ncbi:MAG: LD-carboxypeptidase [Patescibacteria group bacterium]|nr:LD-carboxypeptidase [Patescibacteria group bacterium]
MSVGIIKPPKLANGDTIGIFSPSQSISMEKEHLEGFYTGIKRLEELGFKIKLSDNVKGKYYYSSGTPKQRVDDLHKMFTDKEVKALLMSLGGETANEVLPLLDFNLIKNNPKIMLGMSDGTNLLAPITDKTGLVTFYGPDLIYSFGIQKDMQEFERQMFKCLMEGKADFQPLNGLIDDNGHKMPDGWKTIRGGQAKGRLIGGYLEIIMALMGTNYLNNIDETILFLESMETSSTIHMRLQYLKLMGVFDRINGLILGYFPDIKNNEKYYREIGDIVLEITKDKDFPILQVNELGHSAKNYTWPMGINVELDTTNKTITALESCVE